MITNLMTQVRKETGQEIVEGVMAVITAAKNTHGLADPELNLVIVSALGAVIDRLGLLGSTEVMALVDALMRKRSGSGNGGVV